MLSEETERIIRQKGLKSDATLIEQIKYLEELESQGLIEKPVSQTAYRYPIEILPNGRTLGCKTR